jgi:hypothetical protein
VPWFEDLQTPHLDLWIDGEPDLQRLLLEVS